MKESELVCEDHGISDGDVNYFQNAPSTAARSLAENLAKPAKQCVAGEIRENGKSDAFLESRGLTQ